MRSNQGTFNVCVRVLVCVDEVNSFELQPHTKLRKLGGTAVKKPLV